MTLNAKIEVFLTVNFGLQHTFQERIALKSIEIDKDKLCMKFLSLNVDFSNCLSQNDFLSSRKPAHEGIKERYSRKSRYFTAVGQSFVTPVADRHGPIRTSNDELF